MSVKYLAVVAAALLTSCAWCPESNWHLMAEGYSIDTVDGQDFVVEVHLNQLKQLGGELTSAEFRRFLSERLKWHDMCPKGWTLLPCVEDGSCIQHTRRSITVTGRCLP
jgi:hypothetical protein